MYNNCVFTAKAGVCRPKWAGWWDPGCLDESSCYIECQFQIWNCKDRRASQVRIILCLIAGSIPLHTEKQHWKAGNRTWRSGCMHNNHSFDIDLFVWYIPFGHLQSNYHQKVPLWKWLWKTASKLLLENGSTFLMHVCSKILMYVMYRCIHTMTVL